MLDVNDQTFDREVIKSESLVVVDFWAAWCGPCRMLAPVVEEFARDYQGRLKVFRLDVDANPNAAGRFAIRSIPSLLFFKNGRLVNQLVGACTKSKMASIADEILGGR
ncbi:MAG: thioredoxin [candidate division FCPU426 bacterium]